MHRYLLLSIGLLLKTFTYGQKPELVLPLSHTETITAVDFSYDGQYVLSASQDQQIKIWQRSGELVRTIDDFDEPVRELVASPTGYFFVAASKNKLVVYDFAGNQRYTYTNKYIAESRQYFYPLFAPDGSRIVFKTENSDDSRKYECWMLELLSGKVDVLPTAYEHPGNIQFSENSKRIYTWNTKELKAYTFESQELEDLFELQESQRFLEEPNDYIFQAFYVNERNESLVLMGTEGMILEASLNKRKGKYQEIRPNTLQPNRGSVQKHAMYWEVYWARIITTNHDDQLVLSLFGECEISSYTTDQAFTTISNVEVFDFDMHAISISHEDNYLLFRTHSNDGLSVYDIQNKKHVFQLKDVGKLPTILGTIGLIFEPATCQFSPVADELLVGRKDGSLEMYDLTGNVIQHFGNNKLLIPIVDLEVDEKDSRLKMAYFSPDYRALAEAVEDTVYTRYRRPYYYEKDTSDFLPTIEFDLEDNLFEKGSLINDFTIYPLALKKHELNHHREGNITLMGVEDRVVQLQEESLNPGAEITLDAGVVYIMEEDSTQALLWHYSSVYDVLLSEDQKVVAASSSYEDSLSVWEMDCLIKERDALLEDYSPDSPEQQEWMICPFVFPNTHSGPCRGDQLAVPARSRIHTYSSIRQEVLASNNGQLFQCSRKDGSVRQLSGHRIGVLGAAYFKEGKFIASWSEDHSVKIWNANTGKNLLTYIILGQEDWVVTSPSGLFDASPGAMSKLYYNVDMELIDIEQLKERYYEPGLASKILAYANEEIRPVEGLDQIELFPEITANLASDSLFVELKERNGGIGKVSIFINGKEVLEDANPPKPGLDGQRNTHINIPLQPFYKYLLTHPDSINYVDIRAYNAAGWLKSKAIRFQLPGIGSKGSPANNDADTAQEVQRPKLFAIVVGTQDYRGEELDLSYADKDAKTIAIAIQQTATNLFSNLEKGDTVDIRCLTTTAADSIFLAGKKIRWAGSGKQNISQAFADVASKAKAEDIIVVYFSGHGMTYGNADNTVFYYLTKDIANGNISDQGIRDQYAISSNEITAWLNKIPALKQVLIIDACNSGRMVEELMGGTKELNSDQIRAMERMKDRTGMFVISGSASDKVSYEAGQYGQSLLTYALLKGMLGAATKEVRNSKYVDVMKLFQYARDEVPTLAASINGIQTPMLGFPASAASFDIGILDGSIDIELSAVKPVVIRGVVMNKETMGDEKNLTAQLELALEIESSKGYQADFVYVPTNNYPGAYFLRGLYEVNTAGEILLTANIFQDGTPVITIEVPANTNEEHVVKYLKRALSNALKGMNN
jgi:WD40 repeat protein/uncharacterized caspase-like protein